MEGGWEGEEGGKEGGLMMSPALSAHGHKLELLGTALATIAARSQFTVGRFCTRNHDRKDKQTRGLPLRVSPPFPFPFPSPLL